MHMVRQSMTDVTILKVLLSLHYTSLSQSSPVTTPMDRVRQSMTDVTILEVSLSLHYTSLSQSRLQSESVTREHQ